MVHTILTNVRPLRQLPNRNKEEYILQLSLRSEDPNDTCNKHLYIYDASGRTIHELELTEHYLDAQAFPSNMGASIVRRHLKPMLKEYYGHRFISLELKSRPVIRLKKGSL